MKEMADAIRNFMFGDEEDFGIPVSEKTENILMELVDKLIIAGLSLIIIGVLYAMLFKF